MQVVTSSNMYAILLHAISRTFGHSGGKGVLAVAAKIQKEKTPNKLL